MSRSSSWRTRASSSGWSSTSSSAWAPTWSPTRSTRRCWAACATQSSSSTARRHRAASVGYLRGGLIRSGRSGATRSPAAQKAARQSPRQEQDEQGEYDRQANDHDPHGDRDQTLTDANELRDRLIHLAAQLPALRGLRGDGLTRQHEGHADRTHGGLISQVVALGG